MWSTVALDDAKSTAPSARAKHSATVVGEYVYLLGGRNGNLPTKDFWKYNLITGKWQQLKPVGDKLPCLQEHTAVAYKDNIYVFGGEVGFSAGTETPLWVYDIKANSWRKVRTRKGVASPKGRRGHTALVHNGFMLVYGGYQDLRGSCGELWSFHFDSESWHLIFTPPAKTSDHFPAPRHKHSAVLHGEAMWIYGGMTDLQGRSDFWKWDIATKSWSSIKSKLNPGSLHSHACCKMPSSMIIFGGEKNGQPSNDLWKYKFDLESWEKITISGLKPQPRSESVAFTVSQLLLQDPCAASLESKHLRIRTRTHGSADRGNRHSCLPTNRVAPCENTYVFQPSNVNYTDGSDLAQQYSETTRTSKSLLQEISKLSQMNISRMSNKCSYTVLSRGQSTDSTESLLRQHASPQGEHEVSLDVEFSTPSRGTMVKSKSAYAIKKKYLDNSLLSDEESKEITTKKRVDFDCTVKKIPRDPISVPNFSAITLPTPVLTPVEATKLVYLDTDEENETEINGTLTETSDPVKPTKHQIAHYENSDKDTNLYENFKSMKRGESYSSHLGYADNPLYQQMINTLQEKSEENVSSTSDYASIETMNRLSSASSYSVKTGTPQEENKRIKEKDGPYGFCNPNYMDPNIKSMLTKEEKKMVSKILSDAEKLRQSDDEERLELEDFNGVLSRNTKVVYRHSSRSIRPPSLALDQALHNRPSLDKCRALSASRVERQKKIERVQSETDSDRINAYVPLYVYIIGGKEQGQVTVFQRPISIWKLKLF